MTRLELDEKLVEMIPQQSQRQDSTTDQLMTVLRLAIRVGCYDAAERIRTFLQQGY
jgi:hypothetical protein